MCGELRSDSSVNGGRGGAKSAEPGKLWSVSFLNG